MSIKHELSAAILGWDEGRLPKNLSRLLGSALTRIEELEAELREADDSAHSELEQAALVNQQREAENMRLRALVEAHPTAVEAAYREGYREGYDTVPDGPCPDTDAWHDSDARAALTPPESKDGSL